MSNLDNFLKKIDRKYRTELSERLRLNNDFSRGTNPGEFAGIAPSSPADRNEDGRPYHIVGRTKIGGPNKPNPNLVGP